MSIGIRRVRGRGGIGSRRVGGELKLDGIETIVVGYF